MWMRIVGGVLLLLLGLVAVTSCGTIETREYLLHESNLALMKFAEKGGTATVVIPANMQTAPLINIGVK